MHRFTTLLILISVLTLSLCRAADAPADPDEQEKAQTIAQMRKVSDALKAFKKDRGQYPDYLSDLVPRYIPDADAMLSPTEKRTGRHGDNNQTDPKFRTSFCYEFSAQKFNKSSRTFRELKEQQMEEFGQVVPIVRCFLYGRVLNLSCSGDLFESPLYWETAPEAKVIMDRIGLGPGFRNGEFTALSIVDSETHTPLAGAEVRVTARMYRGLPLPDRTVRAGADGVAQVPLGAPTKGERKLTVTTHQPGYFGLPQTWENDPPKKTATIELEPGAIVGGIVKLPDGKPLAGAEVTLLHMKADLQNQGQFTETPLTTEITDAEGRWKCDRLPRNFVGLAAHVSHASAWTAWFYSSNETGNGRMLRKDLLAKSAELFVEPAGTIHGTVLDADGKPVAGAEVAMRATWKRPPHTLHSKSVTVKTRPAPAPVKTDAAGLYSFPWRDDATVTIIAFPEKGTPTRTKTTATADMKAENLQLGPGRSITGHVTGEDGKPLAGAEIVLMTWDNQLLPVKKTVARTDASGDFTWPTAPLEAVSFSIRAEGHLNHTHSIGENSDPEEKLPKITVKLRKRP